MTDLLTVLGFDLAVIITGAILASLGVLRITLSKPRKRETAR